MSGSGSRFGRRQARETGAGPGGLLEARKFLAPLLAAQFSPAAAEGRTRQDIANDIRTFAAAALEREGISLNLLELRQLVTAFMGELMPTAQVARVTTNPAPGSGDEAGVDTLSDAGMAAADAAVPSSVIPLPVATTATSTSGLLTGKPVSIKEIQSRLLDSPVDQAREKVQPLLMERIDTGAAAEMSREELADDITGIVGDILDESKIRLNRAEQRDLVTMLINDMLGFGPLEALLADDGITDILVNGAKQVYIERGGKLELSDIKFRDNTQVMQIATRIVTHVGRRVDESSPLADARLPDGSRVNIIIPPLAIDGPSISIRKFSEKKISLDVMEQTANLSPAMATVLRVASRARLNILISGGTGSGKTTLLNAMSEMIDHGERVVTIEDAAELQLQQPHVVRLETRAPNLEGGGEITQRDLLKNCLRMRPDRIILGEIRGSEALDMLQAMNTGHEGSMCTVHANRPREALTRLENMVGMSGINLSASAVRTQIADAVDLIIQVSRMRDGIRRTTSIMEVLGMEGDVIITQDLFNYQFESEDDNGRLVGRFESTGLRPHFVTKAEYFGLDRVLLEAMG